MTAGNAQHHRQTRGFFHRARCTLVAGALLVAATAQADEVPDPALVCGDGRNEVHLRLSIEAVRSARGNLTVTVYPDDPQRFLAPHGKLLRLRVPAQPPTTLACLRLPMAGKFEISIYHDENDDHSFNRTWLGRPAEGYGFSNNPKSLLGLPSIEAARFAAGVGDTRLSIHLHY